MKVAIIGRRGSWSTEILRTRLEEQGADAAIIELQEIAFDLKNNKICHAHFDLNEFDGFIIKKMGRDYSSQIQDQLSLLELLELSGKKFISAPSQLRKMISRLSCTAHLQAKQIPMPPTFISSNVDDALNWIESNGPVILKPLYSTKARGMVLLKDKAEAKSVLSQAISSGEKIIYLQQKLELSGSDYAFVFLGGEYIAAFSRVGDGSSWHTTTENGGRYEAFKPPQALIQLADRAQRGFNLDFISVDIALSQEQGAVVFEVSAFGAYRGLLEGCGIDAAALVADYAIAHFSGT